MSAAAILALVIQFLPEIEQLSGELQVIVPIAKQIIAGTAPTAAQLATLSAMEALVSQQAAAKAASIASASPSAA